MWLGQNREHAENEAAAEAVIIELERGLRINIKRDTNSANRARQILKDGRPVSGWVTWYRSDEFRLGSMHYMNIDKVWAMYPQAYADELIPCEDVRV